MFHIPNFYKMDMSFEDAQWIIKSRTPNGNLLDGLEQMDAIWEDHCAKQEICDDEFYSIWYHEINAYNIVFENMRPLFFGKVA